MYRYKIKLYPELLKQREEGNLEETYNDVQNAAEIYNQAGERARVKKKIEKNTIVVHKNYIEFVLACEVWLQQPTRSCKYFIQQLCKLDFYQKLINSSGRLFRGEYEFLEETVVEVLSKNVSDLSDEEALIKIVKLFFRQEDKEKIRKMKAVLIGSDELYAD